MLIVRESQRDIQDKIDEMCDLVEEQKSLSIEDSDWMREQMYDIYASYRTKLCSHVFMTALLGLVIFLSLINVNDALNGFFRWFFILISIAGIVVNWYYHYQERINEEGLYQELEERLQKYRSAKNGYKNYY